MTWISGFFREVRSAMAHLPISWVRALSADGDGPPNWFWPSAMTATVIGLVWGGFVYATERPAFVTAVLVPFCSFVGLTFAAWLTYRGWKHIRAQKGPDQPEPKGDA